MRGVSKWSYANIRDAIAQAESTAILLENPPNFIEGRRKKKVMSKIELIHGDCLIEMKKIPDKSIDLVLTDPPYGINYHSGYYKYGNPHKPIEGDDEYPSDLIPVFKNIAKKAVFSFCRWDNLNDVEKPSSFIAWIKNNWTAGDLKKEMGRQWEGILFYSLNGFEFNKRIPDVIDCRRIPSTQLYHPTEKPVGVIKYLLEACSKKGDIILDPFMGSGTTGVACKELHRNFIGIEIDPNYFKIAQNRINEAQELMF